MYLFKEDKLKRIAKYILQGRPKKYIFDYNTIQYKYYAIEFLDRKKGYFLPTSFSEINGSIIDELFDRFIYYSYAETDKALPDFLIEGFYEYPISGVDYIEFLKNPNIKIRGSTSDGNLSVYIIYSVNELKAEEFLAIRNSKWLLYKRYLNVVNPITYCYELRNYLYNALYRYYKKQQFKQKMKPYTDLMKKKMDAIYKN